MWTRLLLAAVLLLTTTFFACSTVPRKVVNSFNQHLLEPGVNSQKHRGRKPSQANSEAECVGRFRLAELGIATSVPQDCFFQVPPYQPMPIAGVLESMPQAPAALTEAQLRGHRVLSLGEGSPRLLSYMLSAGVDGYGLDLTNYSSEMPQGQAERYVTGDAADFAGLPFVGNGFQHIFSVMLFCCMGEEASLRSLGQQVALIPMGGTLRHAFWDNEHIREDDGTLTRLVQGLQQIAQQHRSEYELRIGLYATQPIRQGQPMPRSILLVVEKLAAINQ